MFKPISLVSERSRRVVYVYFSRLSGESVCGGFALQGACIHEPPSLPFRRPCCAVLFSILTVRLGPVLLVFLSELH